MPLFVPKDRRSLFRQFLAGMYDAVVITDPNGHIIEVNPRAVEYFGREVDEVLDRPVSIFIPGLKQDVVLTGVDNRIEVWSKEQWEKYNEEVEPDVTAIADSLSELGI